MKPFSPSGPVVRALLACCALNLTGCPAIFKDVPPTVARVAVPPKEIVAPPDKATLVIVTGGGAYDGGAQAVTILMDDGSIVAQVVPRSYAVAHISPGAHWFTGVVPELGAPAWCLKYLPGSFEAGKVYTFNTTAPDGTAPPSLFLVTVAGVETAALAAAKVSNATGKVLSKLSYMEQDRALFQQYRDKYRDEIDTCLKSVRNPPDKFAAEFAKPMPPAHARDRIDIPPPP